MKRVEFRHTPKHGSWLNVAECELSAMTHQCVSGRRFGRGVDWQFCVDDARIKLKSLYPKIET